MEQHTPAEVKDKILKMIKDIRVALLATQTGDGFAHARPMVAVAPKEDFDGTLWFFTRADSRKVSELAADSHVLLSYSKPSDEEYVSITGTAEVIRDAGLNKHYWSEFMRTWFPAGPEDPNVALIKVTAQEAEYWDTPSSVLVYAYGYVKARLTGESPKPGDVGHVDFGKAS